MTRENMRRSLVVACLSLLASTGCRTWGTVDSYTWKVKAPETVEKPVRDTAQLVFQVETYLPGGEAAQGVSYFYVIQWVGLQGWDHKGKSFQDESIRVKGGPGTAYICIYAYDKEDKLVQVAKQPFKVVVP